MSYGNLLDDYRAALDTDSWQLEDTDQAYTMPDSLALYY